jgi:hypothetical protein
MDRLWGLRSALCLEFVNQERDGLKIPRGERSKLYPVLHVRALALPIIINSIKKAIIFSFTHRPKIVLTICQNY